MPRRTGTYNNEHSGQSNRPRHAGKCEPIARRVEATDGRSHYVEIGRGENLGPTNIGVIVRLAPAEHGIRRADRTIVEVATANGGRYTIDAHLRHDPSVTEAYAETHVRRLEAMRRLIRPSRSGSTPTRSPTPIKRSPLAWARS